jgi:hypothetical protein
MTTELLDELQDLLDAGTPGAWMPNPYLGTLIHSALWPVQKLACLSEYDEDINGNKPYENGENNAALIVALKNAAPALLSTARENLRLREALEDIARQKLIEELDEEEFDSADFETGYDMIVSEAREALGKEAP